MPSNFEFSFPEMLILTQLLDVHPWVGVPVDQLVETETQTPEHVRQAYTDLQSKGWLSQLPDGSVAVGESLAAVLQAVRDAGSVLYLACCEDQTPVLTLTVFNDAGHYVLQYWESQGLILFKPTIETHQVISSTEVYLQKICGLPNPHRITAARFDRVNREYQNQDFQEFVTAPEKSAEINDIEKSSMITKIREMASTILDHAG